MTSSIYIVKRKIKMIELVSVVFLEKHEVFLIRINEQVCLPKLYMTVGPVIMVY
jgi:hypothetical protein